MFVYDGDISLKALGLYGKNKEWLYEKLNGTKTAEILFAGVDENGIFYMQKRETK